MQTPREHTRIDLASEFQPPSVKIKTSRCAAVSVSHIDNELFEMTTAYFNPYPAHVENTVSS
jgi:hypothetical protein